ncbi:hypothetical protein [Desertibacillus haloalkaliphilus]|uniref:hypothetical protein n=1 Tax=Desertibacillus haloalkaliphilus TaxID=1328930 RepID=UPI001C26EC4F|nr:hypothetical protein [Desertibacillus haloalkaliphilus]MBU8906828.1 hypothetical protein [Desertibacillus haloalkaliphilus]
MGDIVDFIFQNFFLLLILILIGIILILVLKSKRTGSSKQRHDIELLKKRVEELERKE